VFLASATLSSQLGDGREILGRKRKRKLGKKQ